MSNEVKITKSNFDAEVLKSNIPVLVDFWAKWCMPCRMIAPLLEELSTEQAGKIKVGKVNIDEEGELASQYGIESIPTLYVFNKGQIVERQIGLSSKSVLEKLVKPYIT